MPIDALATIIMLIALALIIYGPWQDYCTDEARQTLFELRDDLFDMGMSGEVPFDSREYRKLRSSIERNIRYAHTLTIWRFFAIYAHLKLHGDPDQKSDIALCIDEFDGEIKDKLIRLAYRIYRANIVMMVTKSPLFVVLLGAFLICSKTGKAFKSFASARDRVSKIMRFTGEAILVEAQAAGA